MAAPALRHLSRKERELVAGLIDEGLFEDESDFEEFAVRRALAQFQLEKLWDLREVRPPLKMSTDEIVEEARRVRRAVARKHGA